jgi:hypothetical protein
VIDPRFLPAVALFGKVFPIPLRALVVPYYGADPRQLRRVQECGNLAANKGKDSYSDSALLFIIKVIIRYIAALNTPNQ